MSLYKSKADKPTDGGSTWEAGAYKFKVASAEVHQSGNIMFKLKTWTDAGAEGPSITEWLNITSEKDGALKEVDRRLQVMLGKMEIANAEELVGKAGYIILRKGEKYLEAMPFGGFYTADRKSATGKESMSDRIKEAIEYQAKPVSAPASTPETEDDQPF